MLNSWKVEGMKNRATIAHACGPTTRISDNYWKTVRISIRKHQISILLIGQLRIEKNKNPAAAKVAAPIRNLWDFYKAGSRLQSRSARLSWITKNGHIEISNNCFYSEWSKGSAAANMCFQRHNHGSQIQKIARN